MLCQVLINNMLCNLKGRHHNRAAREADEKSAFEIFDTELVHLWLPTFFFLLYSS